MHCSLPYIFICYYIFPGNSEYAFSPKWCGKLVFQPVSLFCKPYLNMCRIIQDIYQLQIINWRILYVDRLQWISIRNQKTLIVTCRQWWVGVGHSFSSYYLVFNLLSEKFIVFRSPVYFSSIFLVWKVVKMVPVRKNPGTWSWNFRKLSLILRETSVESHWPSVSFTA